MELDILEGFGESFEGIEELLAVFWGVGGVEADTNQAAIGWNRRWADCRNEYPLIEKFFREPDSLVGVIDVDRDDRSRVAGSTESSQSKFLAKIRAHMQ